MGCIDTNRPRDRSDTKSETSSHTVAYTPEIKTERINLDQGKLATDHLKKGTLDQNSIERQTESAARHAAELNKLHAERLEIEREKLELERQKRGALEAKIRAKETADRAQEYDREYFREYQRGIVKNGDSIGELLLDGTHPTGTYEATSSPLVTLSADKRAVTVTVTVTWHGISDTPYKTQYAFKITKKEGENQLTVVTDSAFFKIDPEFLKRTELLLRERFKPE